MSIFISYRRSDGDIVGRIHDAFSSTFGADSVFQDIEDIGAGRRFRAQLQRAIESSKVVVAVIGPDWVQDRIRDPADILRQELETALRKGVPIVPVTLNTTTLPDPASLPAALRPVLDYQAYVVRSGAEFRPSVDRLVDALRPLLGMRASGEGTEADTRELTSVQWYAKARSHAGLGERAEAIACVTRAVELDPGFGVAHSFRGIMLTLEGRRAEAMVALKSALAVNPDDGSAQVLLASNLAATGDLRQAKWWLEKTLKLERPPAEEGSVRSRYAEILLELGRHSQAIEQFDNAIRLMGDDVPPDAAGWVWQKRGDASSQAGLLDDALRDYQTALDLAGPSPQLTNSLGLTQLNLGRAKEATATFDEGIELAPESAGLRFNLACACSRMGDTNAAFEALAQAFERDPDLREAARTDADLAELRKSGAARFARIVGSH